MTVSTLTQRYIEAEFLTATYRYTARIKVSGAGLLGLLNDAAVQTIELHSVSMRRIHIPGKQAARFESMQLAKRQIMAAILSRVEDGGPQTKSKTGFGRLEEVVVMITSPIYELIGMLRWTGRFELSHVFTNAGQDFLSIFDARLMASLISVLRIESPLILFNRRFIDSIALVQKRGDIPT